ncbi:MAG: nucleotidyltransferase family protein [Thalassovita sp.]
MVALGRSAYDGLQEDLANAPPEHLAAIANQSYGQVILHSAFQNVPALAKAIPQDLAIYFAEMQRANQDRNQKAIAQLQEIAAILHPYEIPVIALKGAADLLDPLHSIPAHRYISDLDLLVPADKATQAARLLRQAKGLPTEDHLIRPGNHHHLTQITHPDWTFTVELHIAPGSTAVSAVLNADDMIENAVPTDIRGASIPCREDRFLHHILHGMELRHETANLNLRLLADQVGYLEILPEQILNQALFRLNPSDCADWMTDLSLLARGLMGSAELSPFGWPARALQVFGNPEAARSQDNAFWIRHYLRRMIQNADYRRQTLRKVVSPKAWAEFIAFHKDRRSKFK